jgi:lipoprotein-releasing system permease protein
MILTVALTSGFQYAISQKVFSFWGNIRIQQFEASRAAVAEQTPIEKNDTLIGQLRKINGIRTIHPFATKNAIIRGKESIEGVLLKAVDSNYDFKQIGQFLEQGHWLQFPDSGYSSQINLSTYTAGRLQIKTGEKILIYFIQPDGSHRIRQMTVAGLFKTGIEDYDKLYAIADLRLVQRLNSWTPGQIGGYEVFLDDYRNSDSVNKEVSALLPTEWNSQTIRQVFPYIFDWLDLQNTTIAIALSIIILVAALNLITCLIVLVLDRTKMIGILKAMGSPNAAIQRIFLYQVSFITIIGILGGNLLAFAFCYFQQRYGLITLPEDAYFISTAVVRLNFWQILIVDLGSLFICFSVLIIPTVIIRKIQPAAALQFN